jgi:uncharacterized protein YjlB
VYEYNGNECVAPSNYTPQGEQASGACYRAGGRENWAGRERDFSLRTTSEALCTNSLFRSHHLHHSHHGLVVILRAELLLFTYRPSP